MNDVLLIEGLAKRDKIVFDYVFNYYYSSLCAFCLQYVKDKTASEDLVQDFFVSLWMESHRLQIRTSLKSYLFAAVKNRCLDVQKHQKVAEKFKSYIISSAANQTNSTEQYYAESELRQIVQNSMEKLPPRCREIFEMSRVKGMSNQEISEKLNISKRTVELQISNSLKFLRKELAEFLPIWMIAHFIG